VSAGWRLKPRLGGLEATKSAYADFIHRRGEVLTRPRPSPAMLIVRRQAIACGNEPGQVKIMPLRSRPLFPIGRSHDANDHFAHGETRSGGSCGGTPSEATVALRREFIRRRRRPARGQALVEFALVMPVFFALLFGLIELSLIYASVAITNTAATQATHIEAITGTRSATVDQQAVTAALHLVQPLFMAHIVRIEIYQSDAQGDGPQNASENVFDGTGNLVTGDWPVTARSGTTSTPLYIGVRITYQYTWVTSFIGAAGATLTLQANAIAPALPLGG
jgi:Flp pilus assembly protein TadG